MFSAVLVDCITAKDDDSTRVANPVERLVSVAMVVCKIIGTIGME